MICPWIHCSNFSEFVTCKFAFVAHSSILALRVASFLMLAARSLRAGHAGHAGLLWSNKALTRWQQHEMGLGTFILIKRRGESCQNCWKHHILPSSLIKCACLSLYLFKNCTGTTTFKNNARLMATCNRDYRICIINELCISCHVKRVIRSLFDRLSKLYFILNAKPEIQILSAFFNRIHIKLDLRLFFSRKFSDVLTNCVLFI